MRVQGRRSHPFRHTGDTSLEAGPEPSNSTIVNIDFLPQVQAGNNIPVAFGVDIQQVGTPATPHDCRLGLLRGGWDVFFEVILGGSLVKQSRECWPSHNNSKVKDFTINGLTVPGAYDLVFRVRRASDGDIIAEQTRQFEVVEEGQNLCNQPCPDGFVRDQQTCQCVPSGSGGNGGNGGGGGGGVNLSPIQQVQIFLILLIVLIVVSQVYGDD